MESGVVIKGDASDELPKLKVKPGWGSISLAQSLINDGLVDEYRLDLSDRDE